VLPLQSSPARVFITLPRAGTPVCLCTYLGAENMGVRVSNVWADGQHGECSGRRKRKKNGRVRLAAVQSPRLCLDPIGASRCERLGG
jgi:hypothetical protein